MQKIVGINYRIGQIFSVKQIQFFIVKNTFKATCFGFTEPSSGLFVRRDPYPITRIVRTDHGSVLAEKA